MARPGHPLVEDSFAPLRAEADALRESLAKFRAQIDSSAGSAGKAAAGAADGANKLAAAQDRAAASAGRFQGAVARADRDLGQTKKTIKGVADVLEFMGFKEASDKADDFAKALGGVQDAMVGITALARSGALTAFAAGLAGVVVLLGAAQEGWFKLTGDKVTSGQAAAGGILAFERGVREMIADGEHMWTAFVTFLETSFLAAVKLIVQGFGLVFVGLNRFLSDIAQGIANLPAEAKKAIPGIEALGKALDSMAGAAAKGARWSGDVVTGVGAVSDALSNRADSHIKRVREEQVAARAGIDSAINSIEGKAGTVLISEDPMGWVKQTADEFRQGMKEFGIVGEEAGKTAAAGIEKGANSPAAVRSIQQASATWESGISQAMQQSVELDQAIVDALILDPEDENKVINSFSDLLKNIKNLFRDNPIGIVGSILGVAGGGGGGGMQGFAKGGINRDPRDVVPVLVRHGEGFLSPETVSRYGEQVVNALNRGLIDPGAVRGLAAQTSAPTVAPTGPGFAGGGVASGGGGGGGPMPAYVVADNVSLQRLLTGGRDGAMQWFRHEAANIRAAMGL